MAEASDQSRGRGAIELLGLAKAYGDTPVLEGVDLAVEPGEFVVLVGPSGCGKSTLLRCVAGLEEISGGELRIDGARCNEVHPRDRDLAMVFQSYALYPHMTVAENLAFSLKVRKVSREEVARRVADVAERLGLTGLLDRRSAQLSGGQRQRVAVGRAIVREPVAFLLDEPLSNLDAALRARMRVELKKLHQDLRATMLYVTHDQVEAMTMADRLVVLSGGRVQQVGSPVEVYERPANTFVAGFIGTPPMNFLDARLVDGDRRVEGAGFSLALPDGHDSAAMPASVTAGVRPTSLALSGEGAGRVDASVVVVEPLGRTSYVHLALDGDAREVVAELPTERARDLSPGDALSLTVPADEVHVFHPDTGEAIPSRGAERARAAG